MTKQLDRLKEFDRQIVQVAKNIRLLGYLTWHESVYEEFAAAFERGQTLMPTVTYPMVQLKEVCEQLKKIGLAIGNDDPLAEYLQQTTLSYYLAGRMLENIGTPVFREISEAIYGSPQEKLGKATNLDFANDFIEITDDFASSVVTEEDQECVRPEAVASTLQSCANTMFGPGTVNIVVDSNLSSKAAAGAERIRVRGATSFSQTELDQILQHELYVHTATALNGRSQPNFKSFGLGSPRTTCTQEGIATFAELISSTMDLTRLRRIALRIKGIHIASEGANFVDVFKFFYDAGQTMKESFHSASRIFRGSDLNGRHVFTKDVVYLKGLFSVHTFLRKAIEKRKIDYPEYLFIGRLTIGDVVSLEPYIKDGTLARPMFRPKWIVSRDRLAAYLSYAAFANRLRLNQIEFEDFSTKLDVSYFKDVG